MHEIFHIIGLCPDHFSHINLIDIVMANHENLSQINPNLIIKKLCRKRS